jgi:AcrR family transcriptional regulator
MRPRIDPREAPRRGASATRERLLDVAEAIVLRAGPDRLTLDAVAREAGISKGGILYHFGTKDALIAAMVARLYDEWDHDIERELASAPDAAAPGAWTRAYVRATIDPSSAGPGPTPEVGAAILAAIANDPALLDPLRERFRAWQRSLATDRIDPVLATMLRLAADGLLLAELLDLAPPSAALREQVRARLLALTEEPSAPGQRS